MGEIIRASNFDWTVVRIINPNAKTSGKGYAVSVGNQPFKMSVSRKNIAAFIYEVAKGNSFIHEMPIVYNK